MADRKKVIRGLHCCSHTDGANCIYCPYDISDSDCTALMSMDVLDLLKEQEARKGHWIEDETETYTENHDTWECSECHEPFTLTEGTPEENKFYFCPRCGADMS